MCELYTVQQEFIWPFFAPTSRYMFCSVVASRCTNKWIWSYLHLLGEHSDVITLGADNLRLDVAFLLVRDPAVLLAVERHHLLLCQLLLVWCQVLVVWVVGRYRSHLDGSAHDNLQRNGWKLDGVAEKRPLTAGNKYNHTSVLLLLELNGIGITSALTISVSIH